jgi:NitT/TauT family transport system substrate-binding protein
MVRGAGRHQRTAPRLFGVALVVGALLLGACGGPSTTPRPGSTEASGPTQSTPRPTPVVSEPPGLTPVRVQLRWTLGAAFAGYVAAIDQGYYEAAGLDVSLIEGGPDVFPEVVGSQTSGPEFTISWVPRILQARAAGSSDLVDIGQVFRRSATLSISFRDAGVTRPADLAGHSVGVLGAGNEFEVIAAAIAAGVDPDQDLTIVEQDTDMREFLRGRIEVAQVTIYDGYAQVLEATDPTTNAPYQATDLDVINYHDEGTAMLQDAVFARSSWLAQEGNEAVAARFLKASFQGWLFCRDHPADCVESVVAAGVTVDPAASASPGASGSAAPASASPSTAAPVASGSQAPSRLRAGHEAWAMNEVNPLIWPSPAGIGVMDPDEWQHTVDVCIGAGVIPDAPGADAYRTDLAEAALATLDGLDTTGEAFVKGTVEIAPDP